MKSRHGIKPHHGRCSVYPWCRRFGEGRAKPAVNAAKTLTPAESSAITKINNILTKNFKPGPKGDISGAIHDMVGNPIPKPGGGTYDHVQDLNNILRGLRNNVDALKNATDPAAVAARQQAQQVIQQIEETIKGAGL
ncbi:MAG: polymorphic toxin type 28 domain-containing protein [Methylacidiphilales bacterium]|nr:polymorphic toxin type 28 domain-containing protein [Candidatus Methylacidiphilales bacterium]